MVDNHLVRAEGASQTADDHAKAASETTLAASTASKGIVTEIDFGLDALEAKDYITASQHFIKAKVGSVVIQTLLDQSLKDLTETRVQLSKVKVELKDTRGEVVALKAEVTTLQGEINKQTNDGADDFEVARRCRSWFGVGAIFYGVEHLLKAGILGILILGAVALAIIIGGYFLGGPLAMVSGKLLGFLFRKKS